MENDSVDTDDITVTAAPAISSPFAVRYFIGYYNVTSYVTGSGFTYPDMAPGEIRTLAVQFSANAGTDEGARVDQFVTFVSNSALSSDTVHVGVVARTPT